MASLRSRLFLLMLRNSHLLRFKLRRQAVFDWDSSIDDFRAQVGKTSGLFGKLPEGIAVEPVQIDQLYAEWVKPSTQTGNQTILYFHGGGYVSGTCQAHRTHVSKVVQASGVRALTFEYRLAPENPYPAGLEDALQAYRWLLAQDIAADDIIFMGDSAGGGLALATLLAGREENLPMPNAAVALSPWTDLACTGQTYTSNRQIDPLTPGDSWTVFSKYYVGEADPKNPLVSPLYGDLTGLPPLLLYVGDHEVLLDDTLQFAEKAQKAGVSVNLNVGAQMFHCYPICAPIFPEATEAMNEIGAYIQNQLA